MAFAERGEIERPAGVLHQRQLLGDRLGVEHRIFRRQRGEIERLRLGRLAVLAEQPHLAGRQIVGAGEIAAAPDRPGHRRGVERQRLLDLVQQLERIAALAVHLVDEGDDRDVAQPADLEQLAGARLDALGGVDHHHRRVDRGERAIGVLGEVLVARRVEQVEHAAVVIEGHHRGDHRNAALALDRHPVGAGRAAVALGLDLAGEIDGAAEQQQLLGQRGLAGVRVRDDRKGAPALDLGGERRIRDRIRMAISATFMGRMWQGKPAGSRGPAPLAGRPAAFRRIGGLILSNARFGRFATKSAASKRQMGMPCWPSARSSTRPISPTPARTPSPMRCASRSRRKPASTSCTSRPAGDETDWMSFPHVREALAHWGLMNANEPPAAVCEQLGVKIGKVELAPQSAIGGIQAFLDEHAADLIVLATEGRQGAARWLHGSVAEKLARQPRRRPCSCRPRRAASSIQARGEVHLQRVLIPIDREPKPAAAIGTIMGFAHTLAGMDVEERLLHVGSNPPQVQRHAEPHQPMPVAIRHGDVVEAIIDAATDWQADLIGMPTAGHHGFLDALRGSPPSACCGRRPARCWRCRCSDLSESLLVSLRREADQQLAAAQLDHRALDHRRLRQHQRDGFLLGDAVLVLVGQFLEGRAGAVEQRFPAGLLGPALPASRARCRRSCSRGRRSRRPACRARRAPSSWCRSS